MKTRTGRIWTYVRDDRPFGGKAPPAAVFFYSPDRAGIHPEQHLGGYCGILQADAYAGFNALYAPDRKPGPITESGCWAHARRKLFEIADIASNARNQKRMTISPIAFEAVQKFDAIFELERSINGLPHEARLAARQREIAPANVLLLCGTLNNDVFKAMNYMLKRINVFTRSFKRPSSTTSIPKPGSQTCSLGSPITRLPTWLRCCHGIGVVQSLSIAPPNLGSIGSRRLRSAPPKMPRLPQGLGRFHQPTGRIPAPSAALSGWLRPGRLRRDFFGRIRPWQIIIFPYTAGYRPKM